jgi:hypothetical protein
VTESVNVAEVSFSVEDFLAPFTGQTEGFGEGAEKLDDLCYVVVVFAVFGARLRIEEVVTSYEFENLAPLSAFLLFSQKKVTHEDWSKIHTIAAILQTSVLAPHFAPKITSGDLYCLVWISLVKW